MKTNFILFIRFLEKLIIGTLFGSNLKMTDFRSFIRRVEVNIEARGSLRTILWLKDLRTILYTYLSGNPVKLPLIGLTRDGLPKVFGPLIPLLRNHDKMAIRALLTLLLVSRVLPGWKSPDTKSIIDKPSFDPKILTDLRKSCRLILDSLNIREVVKPEWTSPHITTKSGPNGIAMFAIKADYLSIPNPLWESLKIIGGPLFSAYIQSITEDPTLLEHKSNVKNPKGLIRKLSVVKDVDGKSRVIAMADYWSQTVLKPLHETLMGLLERISVMDVTYGQNIEPFGSPDHNYHSFDLTTATDRIPVEIYQILLMTWFDRHYAKAWRSIMVDYPFAYLSSTIKYGAGQPMGMYSSWVLMSLGHHLIVQYSALKAGLNLPFTEYRLLGDDIVIRHDKVAEMYLATMTSLGVEISPAKTMVSKDTFEFAKRLFFQGVEVTGLPINGFITALTHGSWVDITSSIAESVRRGYDAIWLLNSVRLQSLLTLSPRCGWNQSFRIFRKIVTLYYTQHNFIGSSTQTVGLLWGLPVSCVTSVESFKQAFFQQLLQESSKLIVNVSRRIDDLLAGEVESAFTVDPISPTGTCIDSPESELDFPDWDRWVMGGVTHEKKVYRPNWMGP